ncbi:MAG: type 4a pilus biogenesis protein PilO [Gammaproteobacteria bacterium]
MNLDLSNLNAENIGNWPLPVKIFCAVLVFAVIGFLGWQYDVKELQMNLEKARQKETALRSEFETKQRKAANLPALAQQLEDIKETFGDLLKRLPNKTEVAELLVDISQQGLGAGLEFELFKPGNEQPADFYVELPIQIRVLGDYHEFGKFISGISDLPRIVTSHDIRISSGKDGRMTLDTTAKTYRYIDEESEIEGS